MPNKVKLSLGISLTVLCLGLISSFEFVQDRYFVAYDLVLKDKSGLVGGKAINLTNDWVVDQELENSLTLRKAGLVNSGDDLVTLTAMNSDVNVCGNFGRAYSVADISGSYCELRDSNESVFRILILTESKLVLHFSKFEILNDFLGSVEIQDIE